MQRDEKAPDSELALKLESMNKELFKRERKINEFERNIRELTDRSVVARLYISK